MSAVENIKDVAELVKKLSEATVGTARVKERLPEDIEKLREVARRAISPVNPAPEHAPIS
jgi:hypothetical protein